MATRTFTPRPAIPAETITKLAREFADWRQGGCPGYGFAERFKAKVAKAARACGRSPSEVFTAVHAAAERIYLVPAGEQERR